MPPTIFATGTGPDPVFDRNAIDWLSHGDIDSILENVTFESMSGAGNATHGFMDLILMMGIAGPIEASYVDELNLFHTRRLPCRARFAPRRHLPQ